MGEPADSFDPPLSVLNSDELAQLVEDLTLRIEQGEVIEDRVVRELYPQYAEALEQLAYQQSLDILNALVDESPHTSEYAIALADALIARVETGGRPFQIWFNARARDIQQAQAIVDHLPQEDQNSATVRRIRARILAVLARSRAKSEPEATLVHLSEALRIVDGISPGDWAPRDSVLSSTLLIGRAATFMRVNASDEAENDLLRVDKVESLLSSDRRGSAVDDLTRWDSGRHCHALLLAARGSVKQGAAAMADAIASERSLLRNPERMSVHDKLVVGYQWLTQLRVMQGDLPSATDAARRAIEHQLKYRGRNNVIRVRWLQLALGDVLHMAGDLPSAKSLFREALPVMTTASDRMDLPSPEYIKALTYCPDKEVADPQRAVVLARRLAEVESSKHWQLLSMAELAAGNYPEARRASDRALALRHGGDGVDCVVRGLIEAESGNLPEALKWYEKQQFAPSPECPVWFLTNCTYPQFLRYRQRLGDRLMTVQQNSTDGQRASHAIDGTEIPNSSDRPSPP